MNQKGGTAKTTTTVSVAAEIAKRGKKCLVVDLDPQANATLALGIDPAALELTCYDLLVKDLAPEEILVGTDIPNLHILPGGVNLSRTDINLADRDRKQFKLKDALDRLINHYDYVMIDCPPSLGLLPVNALTASHGVVIPMVPQYFALEGLKQIQATLGEIRKELNPQLEVTGILFCMVDARLKIVGPSMDLVRTHYPGQPFDTILRTCSKISEAQLAGESIGAYAPKSRAAIEYAALTTEILARTEKAIHPTNRLLAFDTIKKLFSGQKQTVLPDK